MSRVALEPVDTADRPFGLPPLVEVSIDLPFPPSVNRTRRLNGSGARLLGAWHHQSDILLLEARRRTGKRLPFGQIVGPFEATIVLSEAHGRADLDNGVKAILDYAKRIELIRDDGQKYLRRLVVEWGDAVEGCRLTLRELINGKAP